MSPSDSPDIDVVYTILRDWAAAGTPRTYTELSNDYAVRTGVGFEPHGTWDRPLGTINNRVWKIKAPALSALVILKETGEPGGNFWECAPNVPSRPKDAAARAERWLRIFQDVVAFTWPDKLP
jgi:hypothetical protein